MSAHICSLADAGYLGLGKLHENSKIPAKKSKLHPLTKAQKTDNHNLSRERIFVENVIRRLKIFRILSERYRNHHKRFALRFNLVTAICKPTFARYLRISQTYHAYLAWQSCNPSILFASCPLNGKIFKILFLFNF
jgi:hypothetical protein